LRERRRLREGGFRNVRGNGNGYGNGYGIGGRIFLNGFGEGLFRILINKEIGADGC
jgi:hypothetical protein